MARDDSRTRVTHIMRPAIAGTAKGTPDLLALPLPFTQIGLLTPEEFVKEAERRHVRTSVGLNLDLAGLEELHRHEILVPFFRVDIDRADLRRAIDTSSSLTRTLARSTVLDELYAGAQEGRVHDPAAEPYESWPKQQLRMLWPSCSHGYLYSRHQLLALVAARHLVEALLPYRSGTVSILWSMDPDSLPDQRALEALRSWRALAVTLTAIEARYWPGIHGVIRHDPEVLWQHWAAFRPDETLSWLGLTMDQIKLQAERLRHTASFDDVVGDFYDVIRRARPEAWETLRGAALTTMDHRVSAELLEQFADDLKGDEPAPPAPPEGLSTQRLSLRPESQDAALTELGLSPHPSLLIAVHGDTEFLLLPRVMRLLGMNLERGSIGLENFEGTHNLQLLARHVAKPLLGRDLGRVVVLDRPVTRFLVVTDAENQYETEQDRQQQRLRLIDAIAKELPEDLKPDLYGREARLVEIVTWGRYPFEFAHFSDARLAGLMLSLAGCPYPKGRDALVRAIHSQRTKDPSPDVEDVFWRGANLTKMRLAEAAWPVLRARVERAMSMEREGPPIMRVAARARQLMLLSYGRRMSLRRHNVTDVARWRRWRDRRNRAKP